MKKILLIGLVLILVLCLPLTACKKDVGSTGATGSSKGNAQQDSYASAKVGDTVQFAGFDWRVLEVSEDLIMIVSVNLLDSDQYNFVNAKMTWAESSLRESLNSYFYDKTFSDEDKALIAETTVINADNPWYGTPGGDNTEDKLFLLSIEEVVKYFGDSGMLANRPEDAKSIEDQYDKARIACYDRTGIDSWWWLRSPGDGPTQAALINQFGGLRICGFDVHLDDHFPEGRGGIRPALWLKTA